jgi:hypothetical protein
VVRLGVKASCSPREVIAIASRAVPREGTLVPDIDPIALKIPANQSLDFSGFLESLDRSQGLRGIRVIFWDGYTMHEVRAGPPLCGRDRRAVVIKPDIGETALRDADYAARRESKFYTELTNVAVGCGSGVIAWVVSSATGAATPITGGASLIVTHASAVAGYAGWASCVNSGLRLMNEARLPEFNDWLDEQWAYTGLVNALDAVALIGGLTAAHSTVKMALHLRNTTGKGMLEVLKGLDRQQRKKLATELIRINNPGISNSMLKAMLRSGKVPKRFTPLQIDHTVKRQLSDSFGALCNYAGSSFDGLINKGVHGIVDRPAKPKKGSVTGSYVAGIAYAFDTY